MSERIEEVIKKLHASFVVDPLFKGLQRALSRLLPAAVGDHLDGRLPSQLHPNPGPLTPSETAFAAVYGLVQLDGAIDPELPSFTKAVTNALGEYEHDRALFDRVLEIIASEGLKEYAISGGRLVRREVSTTQWAGVARALIAQHVSANDRLLTLKATTELANQSGITDGGPPSAIVIDLPDLEAQSAVEIIKENLDAMQAIYFAAMLEELKMPQVVEKLVELFQKGMLPFGKGPAGDFLYSYWKKTPERISEAERRNIYARAFGLPAGDPTQVSPNRDFNDLWLRFLSSVAEFVRQYTVDNLLRSTIPLTVNQEQVRKAGRDLAANLSLHAYGMAYFVATDLQDQIRKSITLLSDSDVRSAYGARDMWQVIDQVATLELGGPRNSIRYRTMATAGAIIIRWLSDHAVALASPTIVSILDLDELRSPRPRVSYSKPMVNPTDVDLVNACQQWLTVTGTTEGRVEQYSQPVEGPNITSVPVNIPTVAKDLLASVGIQAGTSTNGNGYYGGR